MPAAAPVTKPPDVIVAMPVSELLHVTTPTASLKVVVPPDAQIPVVPRIPVGVVFTVTTYVTGAPQPVEYCMVAVPPGATPVIVADVPLPVTVATAVLRLLHAPPVVPSDNDVVAPPQNAIPGPVMGPGVLLVIVSV